MLGLHKVCVSLELWAAWLSGFGSLYRSRQFDLFQLKYPGARPNSSNLLKPTSTVSCLNIYTGRTSLCLNAIHMEMSTGADTFKSLVRRGKRATSQTQSDN